MKTNYLKFETAKECFYTVDEFINDVYEREHNSPMAVLLEKELLCNKSNFFREFEKYLKDNNTEEPTQIILNNLSEIRIQRYTQDTSFADVCMSVVSGSMIFEDIDTDGTSDEDSVLRGDLAKVFTYLGDGDAPGDFHEDFFSIYNYKNFRESFIFPFFKSVISKKEWDEMPENTIYIVGDTLANGILIYDGQNAEANVVCVPVKEAIKRGVPFSPVYTINRQYGMSVEFPKVSITSAGKATILGNYYNPSENESEMKVHDSVEGFNAWVFDNIFSKMVDGERVISPFVQSI